MSIGRSSEVDLSVVDASVSRVHAFIKRDIVQGGSFYLQDNDTKFGSLVQI